MARNCAKTHNQVNNIYLIFRILTFICLNLLYFKYVSENFVIVSLTSSVQGCALIGDT